MATGQQLDIPAPRPWRIDGQAIRDREGGVVVSALNPASMATRRLIVEAVNGYQRQLAEAVREMRAAQREYLRTRTGGALDRAKRAERAVDAILAEADGKPKQEVFDI